MKETNLLTTQINNIKNTIKDYEIMKEIIKTPLAKSFELMVEK